MKQEQEELLALLHPLEPAEQSKRQFVKNRRKQVILAAGAVMVLCVGIWLKGRGRELLQGENQLLRPETGNVAYELMVSDGEQEADVTIQVPARRLAGEELECMYAAAMVTLQEQLLGENAALTQVQYNLNLITELPEYGLTIEWDTSDTPYIRSDGLVKNTQLAKPQEAQLTATLCYGDERREQVFWLTILPYPYSERELFLADLEQALSQADEETALQKYRNLPTQLNGVALKWSEKKQNYVGLFAVLGVLLVVLVYCRAGSLLQQKKKEREEQLLLDYPALLSKLMLLLGAGLTVRGAWERIAEDYRKSGKKRYAYDEMLRALSQMELGVPEGRAYEEFGTRCGLLSYLRFTTLLVQNLKKGSKRLIPLLWLESQEAFSERKEQARRKGEEAGTKLLLPMGGMLVIVLVMILVPAFASFQI